MNDFLTTEKLISLLQERVKKYGNSVVCINGVILSDDIKLKDANTYIEYQKSGAHKQLHILKVDF